MITEETTPELKANPAILAQLSQIKERLGLSANKLAAEFGIHPMTLKRYQSGKTFSPDTEHKIAVGLARMEQPQEHAMNKDPLADKAINHTTLEVKIPDPPKFANLRYQLLLDKDEPGDTVRFALIINGRIENEFHHDEKMFREIMDTCATAIELIRLRKQSRIAVNKL